MGLNGRFCRSALDYSSTRNSQICQGRLRSGRSFFPLTDPDDSGINPAAGRRT